MTQKRRITLTVAAVLTFILVVVGSFVFRINQPRMLSPAEMRLNGFFLLDTPRDIGDFALTTHRGEPFIPESLEDQWTLMFFGFTHCPDVCPTTMAFLNQFVVALDGTEAADSTEVVMVSVDPARDTVEQLAGYVPFFNEDFTGVTGEFLDVFRFATSLNAPFRKVPGQDSDAYQVDHSANVVLINPRGHYHGFFKAPLDLAKMKVTYRAARTLWER